MEEYLPAWSDPLFKESVLLILGFLVLLAAIVFPLQKNRPDFRAGWVSLQSWLFAAPVLFVALGLGGNWPLGFFTILSILGAKEFFQMTGIYHRSAFVWTAYLGIVVLAACVNQGRLELYNLMPMILLGLVALIPLAQNAFKHMLQYASLTLINFILLGWGFLHLGWLYKMEGGARYIIYIILLNEMSDNIALAAGRFVGRKKILNNITSKRTLEGLFVSLLGTVIIAYGMRHLLPNRSLLYWLIPAVAVFLSGSLGDLFISVIRRDLGLKEQGAFILARGGVLSLIDRAVFVAPIFYYALLYLQTHQI